MKSSVKCADCGNSLYEGNGGPPSNLGKCSCCGSSIQDISIEVEDEIHIHELTSTTVKETGTKKPILETKAGDSLFRDTGATHKIIRVIDRKNDKYYELITDPKNGQIIRKCEEPLTHHFGRGSAKFQVHGFSHGELAYGAFCIYEEEKRRKEYSGKDAHWYMAIERLKRVRARLPAFS